MLQWAKVKTAREDRQVIPCTAGRLAAVIYANGDVASASSTRRSAISGSNTFREIWASESARRLRESIANRECHCTTEVFMWPSITYQPVQLARAMVGGKVWTRPRELPVLERQAIAGRDPSGALR